MSKEKQIEEIFNDMIEAENRFHEHCLSNVCHDCEYYGDGECDNHIKAEFLYNAGYRKQEWISVDERLPEDVYGKERKKITVLVCSESGKVSTSSRQRRFKFNSTKLEWEELDTFTWSNGKRVAHWMPLPEAPKMKGGTE